MDKNSMNLESYLSDAGVWHRFVEKPETVHTADASRTTGIDLKRITKNLVCRTSDGRYALLVVLGNHRVNLQKAAQALNARNVQLLGFSEAEQVSGYSPGGTPTICHKTPMEIIVDKNVLMHETIFCGGGTRSRLLELRTEDILKLGKATTADISEH